MKKQFRFIPEIIFFISLLISTSAFGQITVSGKVISLDDRDELIGVSVMETSTNNGVITDIDGKFSLKVRSESSILTFSYVGMDTYTVKVGKERNFNIKMSATKT